MTSRALFVITLFAHALAAAAPAVAADGPTPLRPGEPALGALAVDEDPPARRVYAFEVDKTILAIRLVLEARADLDIVLAKTPAPDKDDVVVASRDSTGREKIYLDRMVDPPLETRRYFAIVEYPGERRPDPPRLASGRALDEVPYRLTLTTISARVDGTLVPGTPVRAELSEEGGYFRTYAVDVPERARALRIDLSDATADLGLRARRGALMIDAGDADVEARSSLGTESLVILPDGDPPLEPGTWFVDVFDEAGLAWPVGFTLRARFDPDPDPALLALPRPPAPRTPLERALYATVEIIGEDGAGSGVIVGERGFILTNYHVIREKVENADTQATLTSTGGRAAPEELGAPLAVALTIDPRDPPREAFRARVVTASAELDLALVEVVSGLYGQPLPADYRFPTVPIGDPARLLPGATLHAVGYPDAGGEGSRVSITITRGIVAGFERRGATVHLKTDAMINAGNSGGAALDERFELVGLPTETISDEGGSGQIGFVRPIWLVPDEWWRIAGARPPGR